MLETGNLVQWWSTMGAFEELSLYFFMKTKCLALWHTKCVKIFFSILASHFELRGHQSKCCRLLFSLVMINNWRKSHVDIIFLSKVMSNSIVPSFVWKLLGI